MARDNDRRLLSIPEAAARLGITVEATRRAIDLHQIAARKVGARRKIAPDEVERMLRGEK